MFKTSPAKKIEGKYCCAYHCTNKPNYKKRGLCHKHYSRYRRIIDPVYERYKDFKRNAIVRGKEFHIDLDEFRKWCDKTGYIVQKGRRGFAATIDRIDNRFGYYIWNIELRSNRYNASKGASLDNVMDNYNHNDNSEIPF